MTKKKDSELMHYGVPKMEWGERRYQNKDGSLTPEGKLHYAELRAKAARRKKINDQKDAQKKVTRANQEIDKKLLAEAAKVAVKTKDLMTRKEIEKGKKIDSIWGDDTEKAAEDMMAALHMNKGPSGLLPTEFSVGVVRVGDEYIKGGERELKRQFEDLIASGKDVGDVEIVDLYESNENPTTVTVDKNTGAVVSVKNRANDSIERRNKKYTKVTSDR